MRGEGLGVGVVRWEVGGSSGRWEVGGSSGRWEIGGWGGGGRLGWGRRGGRVQLVCQHFGYPPHTHNTHIHTQHTPHR